MSEKTDQPIKAFGPSALATPANALTLGRAVAGPVFAIVIAHVGPSWTLFPLWILIALSDGLDGYLARWHGTTRSGAFLDPLADKFLVLGALGALAYLGDIPWVAFGLVTARELAMSVFRIRVGRSGVSVPASPAAKVKTVIQDFVVGMTLFPPIGLHHVTASRVVMWIAVVVTLYSGFEYFVEARRGSRSALVRPEPLVDRKG